jgi:hypothetical protein
MMDGFPRLGLLLASIIPEVIHAHPQIYAISARWSSRFRFARLESHETISLQTAIKSTRNQRLKRSLNDAEASAPVAIIFRIGLKPDATARSL